MTLDSTGEIPAVGAGRHVPDPVFPAEAWGRLDVRERASFTDVFTWALRGRPCSVVDQDGGEFALPMTRWQQAADPDDHLLLDACDGPTVDIGCGPGRMSAALLERGTAVLGVDVVAEAIAQTRERGVPALLRDVFHTLPGEGRWGTALLADGNIGIGGDPGALLARARQLLRPGGRIVVDLEAPGKGLTIGWTRLRCDGSESKPFRWAWVGTDAVPDLAGDAGLRVRESGSTAHRWYAVLEVARD